MELTPQVSDSQIVHKHATYEYKRLPRGETFRYLILEPGGPQDVLRCSLRTSTIVGADYEAISYVWGTEVRDHDIICDGHLLKITKNLHEALKRLRASSVRSLWADSICINQKNLDEKTHQLACMGRIYAQARRVLVYMGPDHDDHASKVSSLVDDMCRLFDDEIAKSKSTKWDSYPYTSPDDPILYDERWNSFETFLHLPWFQRGWVVREAGLARECDVVWGRNTFSWADLMRVSGWLHGRHVVIASLPSSYRPLITHLDSYFDRHIDAMQNFHVEASSHPNRLLDYLARARLLQFRDRRDCVFAFLDLPTSKEPRLSINYDQHPRKVFHDFAEQYLRITGDITLLEFIAHGNRIAQDGLPTWVPKWDAMEQNVDSFDPIARYAWSALMPKHGAFRKPEVVNEKFLKVHGAMFDTVEFLTDKLQSLTTTPEVVFDIWCQVKEYHSFMMLPDDFLAGQFITALTRNLFPLPKEHRELGIEIYTHELLHPTFQPEAFQRNGNSEDKRFLHLIHQDILNKTDGTKFMVTKGGSIGLVPSAARKGDLCGIMFGCVYPCLLRASQPDSSYQFVGPAQVLYFSIFSEPGNINGIGNMDTRDWDVWGHWLSQFHDTDRTRWDVEEQDIYLC
jgi:hypothetical protein